MKTSLIIAALLAAAAVPTLAAAKAGEQYLNADGSCDRGDKKTGGWCVESLKTASLTAKATPGKAEAPKQKRIYPRSGTSFTEKAMPMP